MYGCLHNSLERVQGIYTEGNGCQAVAGGTIYIGRSVTSVKILNSWLSAGLSAPNSSVNYLICNNGTVGNAKVIEKDNFLLCPNDTPGHTCKLYNGVSNMPSKQLTSTIIGDPGASGVPQTVDLLSVSDDVVFMVAGAVHLSRTGETSGFSASHPFIASRDAAGSRHVSVGPTTIPSGTRVNLTFVGDRLRLSCPAFEFGFVVLSEQVDGNPSRYVFNTTIFPDAGMPRKTDDGEALTDGAFI